MATNIPNTTSTPDKVAASLPSASASKMMAGLPPPSAAPRSFKAKGRRKKLSLITGTTAPTSLSVGFESALREGAGAALPFAGSITSPAKPPPAPRFSPELVGKLTTQGHTVKCSEAVFNTIKTLGKGQFGVVLEVELHLVSGAEHPLSGMHFAVKEQHDSSGCPTICPSSHFCDKCTKRVNMVARIAADIDIVQSARACPEVIDYFGVDFSEAMIKFYMEPMKMALYDYYMVDEMKKGVATKVLRKTKPAPFPEHVLVYISMSVLKGLLFLKEVLNALHRDIKPANLLLGANGEIKIGDFGLAKVLIEGDNKNTNVGTEVYLPPERLDNEQGDEYSSESDVWAYGLSMVELGLLRFPYDSRGPFEMVRGIVKDPPPALPADRYSPELCKFFAKCLIKEQGSRAGFDVAATNDPTECALHDAPYYLGHLHYTRPGEQLTAARSWIIKKVIAKA